MSALRAKIVAAIDACAPRAIALSRAIHARPELSWQERFAASALADALEEAGVSVERGAYGLETAFRADVAPDGVAAAAPCVAILAEYDALPEIGHACGHNLIGSGAVLAALALVRARTELPGRVRLLGTPAEEGGAGKIRLIERGAFEGVGAAMMWHPFDRTVLWQGALACAYVRIAFEGKASHAAAAPWDGRSALRALIATFNLVDSARVHLRDGARVHGYITDGGQAVNIIPDHAAAEFSLRAPDHAYLETVVAEVKRCAEGAAHATGTTLRWDHRPGYRDLRNNEPLARRFGEHLAALGFPDVRETDPTSGLGSTDMGDVSHVVPSIHPYLAICDRGETMCHQRAFAAAAVSDRGERAMIAAATCLALTAADWLGDRDLRREVNTCFADRSTA